jgi:hypothetical protein
MSNKEKIQEEIEKCAKDPAYFIRQYIKITHPMRGQVPFDLYRFQERIVNEINAERFNIIRKFRQAGVTTIMCAYSLWYIIFHPKKNVMVVSIGDRESTSFLQRVVDMYEELPIWMKPKVQERNKHNILLSTGSRIRSQPAGAGRGESVSLLIVDEAAFIDKMREFWAAIYPTISTGGAAVLLSTVNGMSNLYYELYRDADAGKNGFNVIDIMWREHPEYTEEWASRMRPQLGERTWLQEFECSFLGTGDNFVDHHTLGRLSDTANEDYYLKHSGRLRVWHDPEAYHSYVIGIDVSYGRERDFSAFHILNLYNGEVVAEFYSNKTSIKDFAKIIRDEGQRYNTAYVCVERNGLGMALVEELWDTLEYDNMWQDEKGEFGVMVTPKLREILLSNLEDGLRTSKVRLNSERTVNELKTFIIHPDTGKIIADDGYHDDLIMSLAHTMYCAKDVMSNSPIPITTQENEKQRGSVQAPSTISASKGAEHEDEKLKEYMKWITK